MTIQLFWIELAKIGDTGQWENSSEQVREERLNRRRRVRRELIQELLYENSGSGGVRGRDGNVVEGNRCRFFHGCRGQDDRVPPPDAGGRRQEPNQQITWRKKGKGSVKRNQERNHRVTGVTVRLVGRH